MSVKIMGEVWELELSSAEQLVLLALADHADHAGENAYPGVHLLAWKCGCSTRKIKYVLRALEERGVITAAKHKQGGRGNATVYHFKLEGAPRKTPLEKRARISPFQKECKTRQQRVKESTPKGEAAVAPQPSDEPSGEPSVNSDATHPAHAPRRSYPHRSKPQTLGDSLAVMVGLGTSIDPSLHVRRTALVPLVQELAWRGEHPPFAPRSVFGKSPLPATAPDQRAHEMKILGEILEHMSSSDFVAALRVANLEIGAAFSLRLFMWEHSKLLHFFLDRFLKNDRSPLPAQVMLAIRAALAPEASPRERAG